MNLEERSISKAKELSIENQNLHEIIEKEVNYNTHLEEDIAQKQQEINNLGFQVLYIEETGKCESISDIEGDVPVYVSTAKNTKPAVNDENLRVRKKLVTEEANHTGGTFPERYSIEETEHKVGISSHVTNLHFRDHH